MKETSSTAGSAAAAVAALGADIISRSKIPYGERLDVVGPDGQKAIVNVYRGRKGTTITVQGPRSRLKERLETVFRGPVSGDYYSPRKASSSDTSSAPAPGGVYVGSDESGKGDYFGPLAVAAFLSDGPTDAKLRRLGVRDSKKLSDVSAMRLAERIKTEFPGHFSLVCMAPSEYNEEYERMKSSGGNLNTLLARLHGAAIKKIHGVRPAGFAVVDAFAKSGKILAEISRLSGVGAEKIRLAEKAEKYPAVAAASVVARAAYLGGLAELSVRAGVKLPKGAGRPASETLEFLIRRKHPPLGNLAKTSFRMR